MKIAPINTNCCPTRKPAFKADYERFVEMPTDLKLNDSKKDLVELKDIGNIVIEQNNKIMHALDKFASIEYEKSSGYIPTTLAREIQKELRGE